MTNRTPQLFFVVSFIVFALLVNFGGETTETRVRGAEDRVVVSAPVQVALAFGDRFLAANLEVIRLAATGMEINSVTGTIDGRYLLRAHQAVTELNACHEDNYYLANSILAWAGADNEANEILLAAANCRHWDFLPAFLYGFNQYFFNRNVSEAQRGLEMAAMRSSENANAMRRFSIMIAAEEIDDEAVALAYLKEQQAQASDPSLANSLMDRVVRLEGLITLRDAQREFEAKGNGLLRSAQTLLEANILEAFPTDPHGIGYEFIDGQFKLRQLRIQGVERPQ